MKLKNIYKPSPLKRIVFFLTFDIILSFVSLLLAYNLRFNFTVEEQYIENFSLVFFCIVFIKLLLIAYFKLYKISWRFFSLFEVKKLIYVHIITYTVFFIIFYIFQEQFNPFPRSVIIIDFTLSLLFLGGLRFSKRLILESGQDKDLKKTLIVGATNFAQSLMKEKNDFYIVSIVDNDDMTIGSYISNIKVRGYESISDQINLHEITSIVIAKEIEQSRLKSLYEVFSKHNIKDIQIVSLMNDKKQLKELSVEDLLARHPQDLDTTAIKQFINSKVVLITGAGGSIGSEISRQCALFGAKELVLLDHSEFNLYQIAEELGEYKPKLVMQSVVNKELLDETFKKYKPDIVIHAAAYKHVPLVEDNITEAILNNIIGTKNTIDCAIVHKVQKFVLISTDKAVRPTNVMGTTKRICELYLQNVETKDTELVAVRFGNVLGSSGSVIPKFKAQIANGGPITVTHPDITRYFMLIPEACELVLQAASLGKGGEIFILDMGEPVKITDLAKKMIDLSGSDIEIQYTGLRAGEKLYEELLLDESEQKTKYDSITVAGKSLYSIEKLNKDIEALLYTENKLNKLKEIVPEFEHKLHF